MAFPYDVSTVPRSSPYKNDIIKQIKRNMVKKIGWPKDRIDETFIKYKET